MRAQNASLVSKDILNFDSGLTELCITLNKAIATDELLFILIYFCFIYAFSVM